MEPIKVKSPVWADIGKTQINCIMTWKRFPDRPMPFTASAADNTAHGQLLWSKLIAGDYGAIGDFE